MEERYAMLAEIKEQPELLQGIWDRRQEITRDFVELCLAHPIKKVVFVGNGSPYFAGCTLQFAAEKLLHAETGVVISSVFNHHTDFNISGKFDPDEVLLVCPAESGHSRGQVDAARRAKAQGIHVMSTTLNPTGVLARTTDVVLAKSGVHEIAMATTKGQTMALFLIFLNFLEAGRALGTISEEEYRYYLEACSRVPQNVAETIRDTEEWFAANEARVAQAEKFWILGYGANYGTAQEAALKFFECHMKPSFALELEDALHGPFRALRKTDLLLFIAAEEGPERDRMKILADASKVYCDNCILIQSEKQEPAADMLQIHSSDVEFVNTMEYLIPLQMLSYLVADQMGIDLSIPLVSELDPIMIPGYSD